MLRRFYNRIIALSESPQALWWLALVSFVESSFFPVPPDAMLIPMVVAKPSRAWAIATVCTIASVAGGFLGYAIGYYFMETWGASIIHFYGLDASFAAMREQFDKWGVLVIIGKGFTPIPYKIVTIACGAFHFDLVAFGLASLGTRGARFFLEAALLRRFGAPIRDFIEKRLTLVTTGFFLLLISGFVALRYL